MQGGFDRTKSLQELEEHNWGDPAPTDTGLVTKCMLLRRKPLFEFSAGDLRIMIGQEMSLSYLIVLAVERLEADPFVDADFYPGDLLCGVCRLNEEFWQAHPESLQRMRSVIRKARFAAATSVEAIDDDVRKELEGVPRILRTAVSPAEEELCLTLRHVLKGLQIGSAIPKCPEFVEVLTRLEWLIPGYINEIHPEFNESLDGVEPRSATKLAENTLEVLGLAWLISDQTLTPLHLRLQVATEEDEISWLDCRLGELSGNQLVRAELGHVPGRWSNLLENEDAIEWAYHVGFGQRLEPAE